MIVALAFVRPIDIHVAFEKLEEYVDQKLDVLLEYIEDNYIGRRARRGRKTPRFKIEWWNVYARTLNGDPRTNNAAEAGHRWLQREFSFEHPTPWVFLETLRRTQKARDLEYDQYEAGSQPPSKRTKYEKINEHVLNIVLDYEERSKIEFLRAIAHNL